MKGKHQRKLRIIVLLQRELMPPETLEGVEDKERQPWRTVIPAEPSEAKKTLPPTEN